MPQDVLHCGWTQAAFRLGQHTPSEIGMISVGRRGQEPAQHKERVPCSSGPSPGCRPSWEQCPPHCKPHSRAPEAPQPSSGGPRPVPYQPPLSSGTKGPSCFPKQQLCPAYPCRGGAWVYEHLLNVLLTQLCCGTRRHLPPRQALPITTATGCILPGRQTPRASFT